MVTFREWLTKLAKAIATQRELSNYHCTRCDLRDGCHLPASRRQMCIELQALRPHWR